MTVMKCWVKGWIGEDCIGNSCGTCARVKDKDTREKKIHRFRFYHTIAVVEATDLEEAIVKVKELHNGEADERFKDGTISVEKVMKKTITK